MQLPGDRRGQRLRHRLDEREVVEQWLIGLVQRLVQLVGQQFLGQRLVQRRSTAPPEPTAASWAAPTLRSS
jgi:hypothetical protein